MGAERGSRVRDRLRVRVRVALGWLPAAMPGNLPEHVDWDTGIGHPGKAGVA